MVQMAGVYDISVSLWTDWRTFTPIYGSPFLCNIASARTSAKESDVAGQGIVSGVAGSAFQFVITARDALGNVRGTRLHCCASRRFLLAGSQRRALSSFVLVIISACGSV